MTACSKKVLCIMCFVVGASIGGNIHIVTLDIAIKIDIGPGKGHNIPDLYYGIIILSSGSSADAYIANSINIGTRTQVNCSLHSIG